MEQKKLKNIRIAIIGPSGAGKTTLIDLLFIVFRNMHFAISDTTKTLPIGHVNGQEYNYISTEKFSEKRKDNLYAEYNDQFNDWYGTPLSETDITDHSVIFNVDVDGARNLKKIFPDLVTIFIKPPSVQELERRLLVRARETEEKIKLRIRRYRYEKKFIPFFDYCLTNNDLDGCFAKLAAIIFKEQGGIITAIDGTAASGKGTIAKELAKIFDAYHLDSGLIYRSITYAMINEGITHDDENLGQYLSRFLETFSGVEDEKLLRTEEISVKVANFSGLKEVRRIAFQLQMKMAYHFGHCHIIAEGRDMTTFVFSEAQYKFFVDCPLDIRAERRSKQFRYLKNSADYWNIYNALECRDRADRERKLHPLKFCPWLGVKKINNIKLLEKTIEKTISFYKEAA